MTSKNLVSYIKNTLQWKLEIAMDRLWEHPDDSEYYQWAIDTINDLIDSIHRKENKLV